MNNEPILDRNDIAVFDSWMRAAAVHSRTKRFSRKVNRAKCLIENCLSETKSVACMWSGGKDSTAMTHLIASLDSSVLSVSEKDDLDYPGEVEYVEYYAAAWGIELEIITPPISPSQWLIDNAAEIGTCDADMHSRAAGLSKACFYGLIEEENSKRDAVFLGLRSAESRGRKMNRALRGAMYTKKPTKWNPSGLTVCTPIVDWSDIDVYAYLSANSIEPLDVYRCVGFMNRHDPWRVRKSWWIPGAASRFGGVAWLRRYYPSLYHKYLMMFADAALLS